MVALWNANILSARLMLMLQKWSSSSLNRSIFTIVHNLECNIFLLTFRTGIISSFYALCVPVESYFVSVSFLDILLNCCTHIAGLVIRFCISLKNQICFLHFPAGTIIYLILNCFSNCIFGCTIKPSLFIYCFFAEYSGFVKENRFAS